MLMSFEQHLSMLVKKEAERPAFFVRETADRMEHYVLIVWPNGAEDRVSLFGAQEVALMWIVRESENWYRMRAPRRSCLQSSEEENLMICVQKLLAA
jgi:hypothetical protein